MHSKEAINNVGFCKSVPLRHFIWLNVVFWGGGILVGFASVLMTYLSNLCDHFFLRYILPVHFLPLVTTPFVFVLVLLSVRLFFPMAQGSGVPQVIAALQTNRYRKYLPPRIIIGKFTLLIALMFGAAIGREGPIIQIGAALMLFLSPLINNEKHDYRPSLIAAGSAAGIAAAFAAPLAGIVFVLECLTRRFHVSITSMLIGSVALSGIVGFFILGYYAYYGEAHAEIVNMQGWLAILIVSILSGLCGGVFTRIFVGIARVVRNLHLFPALIVALIFGFIVVGFGYLSHGQTYGSGYLQAANIIAGHQYPASFAFYKMLANIFSAACGLPGGIFSPALTAGAALGQIFSHWFSVNPDAIIVVGMATFFCGITRLPITSFAIVIEITHVPNMTIPLIVACLIANIFASMISDKPFYDALAELLIKR